MSDTHDSIDLPDIRKALAIFVGEGDTVELRVPNSGKGTASGYFDNLDAAAQAAAAWSGKAPAVYFTINPVKPALLARAKNRIGEYARSTTGDADIVERCWFPLDVDPVRPAGISSTDEEHQAALVRASAIREWLTVKGWPRPIVGDSGNGGHLCYPVELPNDAPATQLLKQCLQALDLLFSDHRVVVDTSTYNAARIWKLYGTLVCKGDSTVDRPHRPAHILDIPQIELVPKELLQALANMVPQSPQRGTRQQYEGDAFDLERWLADHSLDVAPVAPWQGGRKWVFPVCPWNPEHRNRSAYVVQFPSGAIASGCHHNSCQGKGWPELRDVAEPGWRDNVSKRHSRRKGAMEEGSGEGEQRRQGAAPDRAIEYVLKADVELFHDQHGDAFIAFHNAGAHQECWPLKSKAASRFIRWCFYQREDKGLSGEALATARGTLEAIAQFKGVRRELFVRVGWHKEMLYYDLGDWRAVVVAADGWAVVDRPPILFRHFPHQIAQVDPQPGGSLEAFFDLLNIRDPETRLLMMVYLVAGLLPGIPLPVLVAYGEHGSAKSFLFKLLRALLDPSSLATLANPDNLREFVQLAAHHRTVYLDNLSSLPAWQSDALCRLCTGEGFSKRELFTDDDDIVYSFRGLGGVNGINLVTTSSDLLDRAIVLKLGNIPEPERREEKKLWGRFETLRASVLGGMFDTLAEAIRRYPNVKVDRLPRLADFATWGVAIAEALGHTADDFLRTYGINVVGQNEAAIEESLVAQSILGFLKDGQKLEGTAAKLLKALENEAEELHINTKSKGWPKGANVLSKRLREVAPNLRRVGIQVNEHRAQGVRTWSLSREAGGKTAPTATIATALLASDRGRHDTGSPPGGSRPPPEASTSPPENPADSFRGGGRGDRGDVFPHSTAPPLSEDLLEDDVGEV